MYEKITPQFIKECTEALEYFDNYKILPWRKKRVLISVSHETLRKIKSQKNHSKFIENLVQQS